jgi:hypothetical protein
MRVASFAACLVAAPLLAAAQDEYDANPNSHYFQNDIDAEYHQVEAVFGEETATAALQEHAVSFDVNIAEEVQRGRRLGTPSITAANMWAGAVMPVALGSSYGSNETEIQVIRDALTEISSKTGIRFVGKRRDDKYKRWVEFIDGSGCSSAVGDSNAGSWRQGAQQIRLKQRRPDSPGSCRYMGIVAHELLHALGLWHQQGMSNRDKRVEIYRNLIIPKNRFNFDKQRNSNDFFADPADPEGTSVFSYASLMQYNKTSFAIEKGTTVMVAVDVQPDGTKVINQANTDLQGQRKGLDVSDAIELQLMYHCHKLNPSAGLKANFPVRNIRDMCTSRCRCAENQGGCKTNADCQGGLYCAQNVGVYEHLGQRMEIPGLNACLKPSQIGTFAAADPTAAIAPAEVVTPRTDGVVGREAYKALDDAMAAAPGADAGGSGSGLGDALNGDDVATATNAQVRSTIMAVGGAGAAAVVFAACVALYVHKNNKRGTIAASVGASDTQSKLSNNPSFEDL